MKFLSVIFKNTELKTKKETKFCFLQKRYIGKFMSHHWENFAMEQCIYNDYK